MHLILNLQKFKKLELCVTTPNFMVIPHSITELQNFKHITRLWNSTLIPSEVFFALTLSCDFMKCSCYVKKLCIQILQYKLYM